MKSGGEVLLGPNKKLVRVVDVKKHPRCDRDVIHLATSDSTFIITANHRLLVKGKTGTGVPVEAHQLCHHFGLGTPYQIFNGDNFQSIVDAHREIRHIQVIDVCFDDVDSTVLASFPKRTRKKEPQKPFVAFGREVADAPFGRVGLEPGNGFATGSKASPSSRWSRLAISEHRARSEGADPDPHSAWSRGTRRHDHGDPGKCLTSPGICTKHRLFIDASNGADDHGAKPCIKGANCEYCHDRHHEQKRRIR